MLPAGNRLAKTKDIEAVFKRGRSMYHGDIGLRFAPNKLPVSRLTVVVSLKISKKATKRNLLKRRLREILRREILPQLQNGFDIMVLTKGPLLNLSFDELKKVTVELFRKARLI